MFTRRGGIIIFAGIMLISIGLSLYGMWVLVNQITAFAVDLPIINMLTTDNWSHLAYYLILLGIFLVFSVVVGLPFFRLGANPYHIEISRKIGKQ